MADAHSVSFSRRVLTRGLAVATLLLLALGLQLHDAARQAASLDWGLGSSASPLPDRAFVIETMALGVAACLLPLALHAGRPTDGR